MHLELFYLSDKTFDDDENLKFTGYNEQFNRHIDESLS